MSGKRSGFTAAEELAFTTEVEGKCPKCGDPLFFSKRGRKLKRFEIAHIYPLNAKPAEILELKNEERLSTDLNAFENVSNEAMVEVRASDPDGDAIAGCNRTAVTDVGVGVAILRAEIEAIARKPTAARSRHNRIGAVIERVRPGVAAGEGKPAKLA